MTTGFRRLVPVDLEELNAALRANYPEEVKDNESDECDVCSLVRVRNEILQVWPRVLVTAQVVPDDGTFKRDLDRYVIISRYHMPAPAPGIKPDLLVDRPRGWDEDRVGALLYLRDKLGVPIDGYYEGLTSEGGLTEFHHLHGHVVCTRGDGREAGTLLDGVGF